MFEYIIDVLKPLLNPSEALEITIEYLKKSNILNEYSLDNLNDSIKYIIQYEEQILSTYNSFIVLTHKIFEKFSLMETLLLFDGLICGLLFLREFVLVKFSKKKLNKNELFVCNTEIVEKYNNIYILSSLDRYLLYLLVYISYTIINYSYPYNKYNYIIILLCTLPSFQNRFFHISFINKRLKYYNENKVVFMKYSISKLVIHYIESLHPQIEKIENYQIFLIYKCLSINFLMNIFTHTLFLLLLNLLKSFNSTYWYYKAIKIAYFKNTGYYYNTITLDNAIYMINTIINGKRWREFEKIEIVNALLVLIFNKYDLNFSIQKPNFIIYFQLKLFSFFSLLSLISLLKVIKYSIENSGLWICISLILIYIYLSSLNTKNILTSFIIYFLILFNINDLIITLIIIIHKVVYYWINEILFFIKNINNIRKVLKNYYKPYINEYCIIDKKIK